MDGLGSIVQPVCPVCLFSCLFYFMKFFKGLEMHKHSPTLTMGWETKPASEMLVFTLKRLGRISQQITPEAVQTELRVGGVSEWCGPPA